MNTQRVAIALGAVILVAALVAVLLLTGDGAEGDGNGNGNGAPATGDTPADGEAPPSPDTSPTLEPTETPTPDDDGEDGDEAALRSFYIEATIEVEESARGEGGAAGITESNLRWWHERAEAPDTPDRWRWEFDIADPADGDGGFTVVSDGECLWFADPSQGLYESQAAQAFPAGSTPVPPISVQLGPANAEDIDDLVAQYQQRLRERENAIVEVTDDEEYLDRTVQVIEYRPVWTETSGSSGTATPQTRSGGTGELWVDAEHMLVLRNVVDGGEGGQSYVAEVTTLEENPGIDSDRFEFEPPDDAENVIDECNSADG